MATGPLFKGPSIHELLKNRGIVTYFQPILSARQRSIVGLEALSRGVGEDSGVIPPRTLFNAADEAGLVDDLDQLCRQQAVRAFARLREEAGDHMLFLNLHVPVAQTPAALASEIDDLVTMGGLGPRSLAIEILEAEIQDMGQVTSACQPAAVPRLSHRARRRGVRTLEPGPDSVHQARSTEGRPGRSSRASTRTTTSGARSRAWSTSAARSARWSWPRAWRLKAKRW